MRSVWATCVAVDDLINCRHQIRRLMIRHHQIPLQAAHRASLPATTPRGPPPPIATTQAATAPLSTPRTLDLIAQQPVRPRN